MAKRVTAARRAPAGAEMCADEPACRGEAAVVDGTDEAASPSPQLPPGRRRAAQPAARKPVSRKPAKRAPVRWSAKREELFLETLAQTGNVQAAVRRSKLSDTTVYRRRRASEAFRARWAVALREGFVKLETLMLERALAGVEKPVWHGGKQVGTIHEYDNRLCLALLNAHRGTVTGAVAMAADMSPEAMRAAVSERLSEMNRRMGGAG